MHAATSFFYYTKEQSSRNYHRYELSKIVLKKTEQRSLKEDNHGFNYAVNADSILGCSCLNRLRISHSIYRTILRRNAHQSRLRNGADRPHPNNSRSIIDRWQLGSHRRHRNCILSRWHRIQTHNVVSSCADYPSIPSRSGRQLPRRSHLPNPNTRVSHNSVFAVRNSDKLQLRLHMSHRRPSSQLRQRTRTEKKRKRTPRINLSGTHKRSQKLQTGIRPNARNKRISRKPVINIIVPHFC